MLLSPIAAKQSLLAVRLMADAEAKVGEWQNHVDRAMAKIAGAPKPYGPAAIQYGENAIALLEDYAETLARDVVRLEKRIRRDVKSQFATDPSLGAVTRSFGQKIVALERRKIEALLDMALFIRADVALASADNKAGEMFDDPTAFLRSFDLRPSA